MFRAEERQGKVIGFSLDSANAYFFFGNRLCTKKVIEDYFPKFQFIFLKQVHGRKVAEATLAGQQEADAHFTSQRGLALVTQTADCMPILLSNRETICAIHSGWRGTAQNIVAAAKTAFIEQPPAIAAIGPHLLRSSFEVGHDVAEQLLSAAPDRQGLLHAHADPTKTFFDLTELVRRQIRQSFGADVELHECLEDTQTSLQYHSFRRDKVLAGRQFSFVVLKP